MSDEQSERYGATLIVGQDLNVADTKPRRAANPSEPESYRRDFSKAEVHIVDGGHFALDTAADEIAAFLVRGFMGPSR